MQIPLSQLTNAIRIAQSQRLWKPKSAEHHLRTRKVRGHLPKQATLEEYEQIIIHILTDVTACVYIYREKIVPYIAVSALYQNALWLVMFATDGILETAFIVENPTGYLQKSEFTFIDTLENLV